MLEASKVTVGQKTYDLNYLSKTKKTNLRRKLIIELIQSKPAGEIIRVHEFQKLCHFGTQANTYSFIKRMLRDGVITRYEGDRPKSYYYAVTGATRQITPPKAAEGQSDRNPDINAFIADMQRLGVKFTITISNEEGK